MHTHSFKKRVRYGETDKMGYLYYGHYAQYYEIGRAEMIRDLGLTYRDMEEEVGIMMPVVSMNIRFVRPAKYDELLTIKTSLRKLPGQFITFDMQIFNENEELLNGGSVRLCFVDMKTQETVTAPDYLLERLRSYFD